MTHRTSRHYPLLVLSVSCVLMAACSNPVGAPTAAAAASVTAPADVDGTDTVPAAPTPTSIGPTALPTKPQRDTEPAIPATIAAGHGATTACALVTEQEAAGALGADPGPGQETPLGDTATACSYLAGQSSLQLSLRPSGGKAVYDTEHAGIPSGTTGITEVSGVGDGAFSQVQGTRAAINFDKGDAMVVIGLSTAGAAPTQDQLIQLATAAAGRI